MRYWIVFFLFLTVFKACAEPQHGIAMHGEPKYPKNFSHFDYINPNAPKGGILKQASFGSFDTFNPFVIKGNSAPGISILFETLMTSSADEPFSAYGLLAQTIEIPEDRSWVAFTLKPQARFHDGSPVTADDVVFSFNILKEKGIPQFRYYYGSVEKAEKTGDLSVRFTFYPGDNRELPLILGQMPVLSKKDWENKDFTATTLTVPVGSGPYLVKDFEIGRFITYQRNPNYWGKDEAVNIGHHNFDELRYDVYRDTTVAVEALKSGAYDVRIENEAKKWATAYERSDLQSGKLVKKSFKHALPSGMQGFVFNTRRPLFQDVRVREALGYALNFNWINQNLFYNSYTRTQSYFDNSNLGAKGLPTNQELALLNPFKDELDPRVFSEEIKLPSPNPLNPRPELMKALSLLKEAGWEVKNGILQDKNGKPFEFEILLDSSGASAWERISLPFTRMLKKLGIKASIRVMDMLQYKNRLDNFDYDMFVFVWGQSLSPGNEQSYFWSCSAKDQKGSYNFAGICDKTVDVLIEKIISAKDRQELETATKALDRVLMWGFYVIPHWYLPETRVVFWDKFGYPENTPMHGTSFSYWWAK